MDKLNNFGVGFISGARFISNCSSKNHIGKKLNADKFIYIGNKVYPICSECIKWLLKHNQILLKDEEK